MKEIDNNQRDCDRPRPTRNGIWHHRRRRPARWRHHPGMAVVVLMLGACGGEQGPALDAAAPDSAPGGDAWDALSGKPRAAIAGCALNDCSGLAGDEHQRCVVRWEDACAPEQDTRGCLVGLGCDGALVDDLLR